jgi:hypothetical protein
MKKFNYYITLERCGCKSILHTDNKWYSAYISDDKICPKIYKNKRCAEKKIRQLQALYNYQDDVLIKLQEMEVHYSIPN